MWCGWATLMAGAASACAAPLHIAVVDKGMLVEQIGRAMLVEAYARLHLQPVFRERPAMQADGSAQAIRARVLAGATQ